MASSSLSSHQAPAEHYDVFISFIEEDTARTFASRLHHALWRNGISTFFDHELRAEDNISSSILRAIRGSTISIIIFCENYAGSKRCLMELENIMECKRSNGQTVIPVFYGVDPSHVRNQTGDFGAAHARLEERLREEETMDLDKIGFNLKEAGSIAGWQSSLRNTHEFDILLDINNKLDYRGSHAVPPKVHSSMCTELMTLVCRIEKLFPEIEAARPRCSPGIRALCSLKNAIGKAKLYLQNCRDSSKLYLAITGDAILSRFQKAKDLFVQNLCQLQTMVSVMLAAEMTEIIDDLKGAKLVLDSLEDEAGKAMRELFQLVTPASSSDEYFEIRALQLAASRLHITSSRAIVVEKRSIKNLLDKLGSNAPEKKTILNYLLRLLKKHGNKIMAVQPETAISQHEGSFALVNSFEVESRAGSEQNEAQTHTLTRATPPEEFKCPMSMRMMYDPVVIASGQTFERIWIQRWFDECNDTCPKTKVKLSHRLLTPNATIKDLISRWCEKYGITIQDPSLEAFQSLDISTTSIASLGSFANNLQLPLDISNVSLGSLDNSYSSDSTRTMVTNGSRLAVMQKASDSLRQNSANMSETDLEFLSGLDELPWESKLKLVEDVKNHLQYDQVHFYSLSSKNFVDPLVKFLRDSWEQNDVRAQRTGADLLLAFVKRNRKGVSDLHEDTFSVLSSFLPSEITDGVLAILEVLSSHPHYRSRIAASDALSSMLKILDSKSKDSHEQVIKILQNLSSNHDICSEIISLEFIPKLVPFMDDRDLARYCVVVLKNLCQIEEARVAVAETNGCIASIADLLDSGSPEDQEHAVGILLSLCSQRVQYCKLVMDESRQCIVAPLTYISVNGNDKGKIFALELLRQLRNIEYVDEQQCCGADIDAPEDAEHQFEEKKQYQFEEKKPSSKPSGFFKKIMFPKRTSLASKKK